MADQPVVEPEPVQLHVGSAEEPDSDRNEKESQDEDTKEDEGERTEKSDLSPKEEKIQTKSRGKRQKTETVTPTSERPSRERKSVERYSVSPAVRTPTSKGVSIGKGRGTQLKDIPNVAFKLSKRKPDDNLQLLHTLLFGKKAKTHSMKKNIGQFSGYVWSENEEKQRSRVKEKLDKCVKEKLVFLCDVLDIPINKALIKKEELSVKLLEFLESPHTTTDALLAEKEQKGQKRKKKSTASKVSGSGEVASETPVKKQKQTPQSGKKRKQSSTKDDSKGDEKVLGSDSEDDSNEDNDKDTELGKGDIEPQEDEDAPKDPEAMGRSSSKETVEGMEITTDESSKQEKKESPKKSGNTASKSVKSPSKSAKKSSTKKSGADAEGASGSPSKVKETESKKKSAKKGKEKKEKEDEQNVPSKRKSSSKKQPTKPAKDSATDKGKGKSGKKTKKGPTKEEMHAVVVNILKVVDFNTATLSDILKQLSTHFGVDLINRKAEVKEVITDVINNMTDEEDEGEEEEDEKEGDEKEGDEKEEDEKEGDQNEEDEKEGDEKEEDEKEEDEKEGDEKEEDEKEEDTSEAEE